MNGFDEQNITVLSEIYKRESAQTKLEKVQILNKEYILKTSKSNLTKEFKITSMLDHKNICKAIKQVSNNSYLMKYYPNGNLSHKHIPQLPVLIKHFSEMCKAVDFVHSQNICHLDIKLENFALNSKGTVKLIDFGHACYNTGAIQKTLGTNKFNAPERYQKGYDGVKADIFSLGVCLLGMVVGFVPFARHDYSCKIYSLYRKTSDTFWDMAIQYLEKNQNFDGQEAEIDQEAIDLIDWMIKENPDDRPTLQQVLQHNFFNFNNC